MTAKTRAPAPPAILVLTGDVVGSSKLGPDRLDRLFALLEQAHGAIAAWPGPAGPAGFDRYRGDGWQMLLPCPRWALRACLMVRAWLRAADRDFETRAMAGIGPAGTAQPGDLSASGGEAFRLSGQRLDRAKRPPYFDIRIAGAQPDREALLSALFGLADALSQDWTEKQAAIFRLALAPGAPDQHRIATSLTPSVSQQTVSGHYQAGGGPALDRAVQAFEAGWPLDREVKTD